MSPALVAASEAELLTVARALVGQVAPEGVSAILRGDRRAPAKLAPTAMRLLQATLARGAVRELARRGGWRAARFLRDGEPGPGGRLWERHGPIELRFTGLTIELLRWLVRSPLGGGVAGEVEWQQPPALGDELVLYLACDLLDRTACREPLRREPAFARSALCWLAFPQLLASEERAPRVEREPRFEALATGAGAVVLEALQSELARRVVAVERRKREIRAAAAMCALGRAQEAALGAFLDAADRAGRRDLAGFLVSAAERLLARPAPANAWTERLEARGTLRERSEARRAAGAFLRALGRLAAWAAESRAARFFDEGYAGAQLLLAQWEFLAARGQAAAEAVLRELDALEGMAAERSTT